VEENSKFNLEVQVLIILWISRQNPVTAEGGNCLGFPVITYLLAAGKIG
jgi:hypothetical protein